MCCCIFAGLVTNEKGLLVRICTRGMLKHSKSIFLETFPLVFLKSPEGTLGTWLGCAMYMFKKNFLFVVHAHVRSILWYMRDSYTRHSMLMELHVL